MLVVNEEVSMMPAEAINMDMYRAMWGRHEQFSVHPDEYAELRHLFGRMPLAVFLGDFPRRLSAFETAKVDFPGGRSHRQGSLGKDIK